ncbi:MAG: phosphohydrolase [Deltaproteobacteria bacterium]|nr:phosphohydrolase [Deltaproteobacteria bacterium]
MVTVADLAELDLAPLPTEVADLCAVVAAPERLVAHLTLVHDVAGRLIARLEDACPGLVLPAEEILFGAATHDIGKAVVPEELTAPGHAHEEAGYVFLVEQRVPPRLARFTVTHGEVTTSAGADLADVLVALADKIWRGKRDAAVEELVCAELERVSRQPPWTVYALLDEILSELAATATARLQWQQRFQI